MMPRLLHKKSRPEGRLLAPTGSEFLSGFPQGRGFLFNLFAAAGTEHDLAGGIRSLYRCFGFQRRMEHALFDLDVLITAWASGPLRHLNLLAIGTLTTTPYHGGQA